MFQSTLPTRGSDLGVATQVLISIAFQSTLPTRGSDGQTFTAPDIGKVSIHAPHEGERRSVSVVASQRGRCFNPRSPRGGATMHTHPLRHGEAVSIHAPHEGERLLAAGGEIAKEKVVSIHAPHEGERRSLIPQRL